MSSISPTSRLLRAIATNEYVRALAVLALILVGALIWRSELKPIDVVMLFLLGVVVVGATCHRRAAIVTVVLSTALFDWFFVPPYNTFSVLDSSYIFTFAVMFIVALIMSALTAKIREQGIAAQHRELRASALYEMIRDLGASTGAPELVKITARHLGRVVGSEAEVVLVDEPDRKEPPRWPETGLLADPEVRACADHAYRYGKPAGWGTSPGGTSPALVTPLLAGRATLGIGVIPQPSPDRALQDHELRTIELLGHQAAQILERMAAARPTA